jgi:hypothetical protein
LIGQRWNRWEWHNDISHHTKAAAEMIQAAAFCVAKGVRFAILLGWAGDSAENL